MKCSDHRAHSEVRGAHTSTNEMHAFLDPCNIPEAYINHDE